MINFKNQLAPLRGCWYIYIYRVYRYSIGSMYGIFIYNLVDIYSKYINTNKSTIFSHAKIQVLFAVIPKFLPKDVELALPETNSSPLKIDPWKRRFLLETTISRCYVSFRECISSTKTKFFRNGDAWMRDIEPLAAFVPFLGESSECLLLKVCIAGRRSVW